METYGHGGLGAVNRTASAFTAIRASTLALMLAASSCITPPALTEVRGADRASALAEFPPGTEAVEIAGPTGPLRGFFVPAGENAPVVVHLLGSGGSVAAPYGTPSAVAFALLGFGFASLLVDYTGVGASPGERSVDNLATDARAIWNAALARVGGDAKRVHVRATSIGTLATAELLAEGIRPASLVLVAPVMPGSAVARGAATLYGDPVGVLAEWLYRPITDASLVDVLPHAPPTIVFAPEEETFAWDREIAALRMATDLGGGTWRHVPGNHVFVSVFASQMLPGEEAWWMRQASTEQRERDVRTVLDQLDAAEGARVAADENASRRLELLAGFVRFRSAREVAAAALALDDEALAVMTLCTDWCGSSALDLAATVDAFSATAPVRPVEVLDLCVFGAPFRALRLRGGQPNQDAATWWKYAQSIARGETIRFKLRFAASEPMTATVTLHLDPTWKPADADSIARGDDVLRLAQVLMRSAGVPCRAHQGGDGNWRVEMWREGKWQVVGPP